MITRNDIFNYVNERYHIIPDYPWKNHRNFAVLRHNSNNKWFALIMDISADKIGLNKDSMIDVLNIKVQKEMIGGLRKKNGFYKAYHMDKSNWVTVNLSEIDTIDEIEVWLTDSYDLTS
ncbi:MmcQ/YjbR family DNA-binding protein [Staphylococcus sp. ACRSN]|uniref:MmcQ/YjbR family DNA-binding protein n=1 Tax=Staphylococcus sp. ACRSN TaxID=2918214 RepID=UPI001EF17152|nr:MmcQ/YjbR family DNA-binding protein [Staphylococcus sp. ACRSN]MCG7338506.1 MmcQ/YjbR family DNA-binding protein [Staphylococcus sp. ACRSN]